MRITEKKKENWTWRLNNLKSSVNKIYGEISECGVSDDKMNFLANMTCNFDESMAEIEDLEEAEVRP